MSFKALDFFQKITLDNVTKPTLIGSILSISAINVVENTTNKDVIGTDNNKYFLKPYMEILSVLDWILKS